MSSPFFVVYSPSYGADIGAHVFRTEKYRLVMGKLARAIDLPEDAVLTPHPAPEPILLKALDRAYYDDLVNARQSWRTISSEIPITREIIEASFLCAGGSILAAREALERQGICYHAGGGWHHAFRDHAEGFCYINDIAIGILAMIEEKRIRRALVVDLDLHQGNGTAVYFQTNPDVFTFSMHQEQLYPPKKRSDLDIGLNRQTDDATYLALLRSAIPRLYDEHRPELIFYVAGADPYVEDQLGNLSLTKDGLRVRDELVLFEAANRRIPVVITLAGGYAIDLKDTVDIHVATARIASEAAAQYRSVEAVPERK